jgi:enoyl-CoA hydratase
VPIHYELRGHIALITIDRPERRGAMTADMYAQLADAWRSVATTPSVRVAVITGVGNSYCAGSDLADFVPDVTDGAREQTGANDVSTDGSLAVLRDVAFPKPIVAAVNGPCLASGLEMLLATDIRVAAPDAVFGIPEVSRGLFSLGGSSVRLPRQVPFAIAMEILLTGRHLTADEALRCGLVNRVVARDVLLDTAFAIAGMIADNSPTAVTATKRSVLEGLEVSMKEAYELEMRYGLPVFASPDAVEGPRAFIEHRAPHWTDDESGLGWTEPPTP